MKVFKYIILIALSFNCIISMEQEKTKLSFEVKPYGKLPIMAWDEIASFGVNLNGKTEKDVFAVTDKMVKSGGDSWRAIDSLIRSTGRKKKLENYNYRDFKVDIMQEILIKRAKRVSQLSGKTTTTDQFTNYKNKLLEEAIEAEAYNWAKRRIEYDKDFKINLDTLLNDYIKFFNDQMQLSALELTSTELTKFINLIKNKIKVFFKFGLDNQFISTNYNVFKYIMDFIFEAKMNNSINHSRLEQKINYALEIFKILFENKYYPQDLRHLLAQAGNNKSFYENFKLRPDPMDDYSLKKEAFNKIINIIKEEIKKQEEQTNKDKSWWKIF